MPAYCQGCAGGHAVEDSILAKVPGRRVTVKRATSVKTELTRRMHEPVANIGGYLRSVLLGHYRYYGVPLNRRALEVFLAGAFRLWRRVLGRRSPKGHIDARHAKTLEIRSRDPKSAIPIL